MADTLGETLRCSFCGKAQDDVKKLIAGAAALICNECVVRCHQAIQQGDSAGTSPLTPAAAPPSARRAPRDSPESS